MRIRMRAVLTASLIPLSSIVVGWFLFMLSAIVITRIYESKPQSAGLADDLIRFLASIAILATWLLVWHRLTMSLKRRLASTGP